MEKFKYIFYFYFIVLVFFFINIFCQFLLFYWFCYFNLIILILIAPRLSKQPYYYNRVINHANEICSYQSLLKHPQQPDFLWNVIKV